MQLESTSVPSYSQKSFFHRVGVAALIFIVVGAITALWLFSISDENSRPTGKIYFSFFRPTISDPDRGVIDSYVFNLQDSSLTKISVADTTPSDMISGARAAIDDPRALVLTVIKPEGDMRTATDTQIYTIEDGTLKQITNAAPYLKEHASWSTAQHAIVFNAKQTLEPVIYPEDTEVYKVSDAGGDPVLLGTGYNPQMSPDGTYILVLKNNGLHRIRVSDGSSTEVWGIPPDNEATLSPKMHFDLSPDGTQLVWADPFRSQVRLFRILSWEPFRMELTERFAQRLFWPVFSPDGAWITAVEMGSPDTNHQKFYLKTFVALHTKGGERIVLKDLSTFNQSDMFIRDWQQ